MMHRAAHPVQHIPRVAPAAGAVASAGQAPCGSPCPLLSGGTSPTHPPTHPSVCFHESRSLDSGRCQGGQGSALASTKSRSSMCSCCRRRAGGQQGVARLRAGQAGAHPQQRGGSHRQGKPLPAWPLKRGAPTNWSVLQGFDPTPPLASTPGCSPPSVACLCTALPRPSPLPLSPRTFMKSMVSLVGTSPATRPQYLHAWGSRAPPGGWGQQADTAARHGRPGAGCTFGKA